MDIHRVLASIAAGSGIILLLLALMVWASGYGGLQSDVERNRQEILENRQEIREIREELRQEIRELREEVRLSQEEIVAAIRNHKHDPGTGETVFTGPVP